jgi:hypothetical protein
MTGETKKTKETKKTGAAANQPSQGSGIVAEGKVALSLLPAEALSNIFGFFRPAELARMAPVSKDFLFAANDLEGAAEFKRSVGNDGISFAPGRNEELNRLVEGVAQSHTDFTDLHRILLQPGHQVTDNQQQLFSCVRGEILAGRLSLLEVVDQIGSLYNLSTDFFSSASPLAKSLGEQLGLWQRNTLQRGFTFRDLCSHWMSPHHVIQVERGQQTVEQLRGLINDQVVGLANGFTLAHVRSGWFTRLRVEAAQPPFNAVIVGNASLENVLKDMLRVRADTVISAELWRSIFLAPPAWSGGVPLPPAWIDKTPLYLAASYGHVATLRAMFVFGGFTPEGCRAIINKPLMRGDFAGRTPFYAAASNGGAAAVLALGQAGNCTPQQWRSLIESPLLQGTHAGMTPLYAAAINDQAAVISIMRRVGGYTPAAWRVQITAPLLRGAQGVTPLYAVAKEGRVAALNAMRWAGEMEQEWQKLISKPLEGGSESGRTPFYAAAVHGHIAVIKVMREIGGYTAQQWRELIETPLSWGDDYEITIFHATVLAGHAEILELMRQTGRYTQQEWRTLITTPTKRGILAGETPLRAASSRKHTDVLYMMLQASGYMMQEWRDLLAEPSTQKSYSGGTPSPAMPR